MTLGARALSPQGPHHHRLGATHARDTTAARTRTPPAPPGRRGAGAARPPRHVPRRARPGRRRGRAADLAGTPHHRLVVRGRRHPGRRRHRRRRQHPLVERVRRPAVAPGRPRGHRHHRPGAARLGGGLRDRVPDPGGRRADRTVDHRAHHHRRHRRHADPHGHRHRSLRADVRHRPGHRLRLLALGVQGLRQHRHHPAAHRPAHLGVPAGRRVLVGGWQRARRRARRAEHHPLVEPVRQRPAVAEHRLRRRRHHQPGGARLGGRLRHRLPPGDVRRRCHLDHDLRHHHRPGWHRTAHRHRHRSLPASLRHRPGHRLRLLAVGGAGVRRRGRHRHHRAAALRPHPPAGDPRPVRADRAGRRGDGHHHPPARAELDGGRRRDPLPGVDQHQSHRLRLHRRRQPARPLHQGRRADRHDLHAHLGPAGPLDLPVVRHHRRRHTGHLEHPALQRLPAGAGERRRRDRRRRRRPRPQTATAPSNRTRTGGCRCRAGWTTCSPG